MKGGFCGGRNENGSLLASAERVLSTIRVRTLVQNLFSSIFALRRHREVHRLWRGRCYSLLFEKSLKIKKKYIDINNMFIKLKCVIGCIWQRLGNSNDAARGAVHVVFEMENNKKRPCQRVLRRVLSATTMAGRALYLSSIQTKFVAANWLNSWFFWRNGLAWVK